MLRVLHVIGAMDRGGAETMVMNLYRAVDRTQVQFDYLVHETNATTTRRSSSLAEESSGCLASRGPTLRGISLSAGNFSRSIRKLRLFTVISAAAQRFISPKRSELARLL